MGGALEVGQWLGVERLPWSRCEENNKMMIQREHTKAEKTKDQKSSQWYLNLVAILADNAGVGLLLDNAELGLQGLLGKVGDVRVLHPVDAVHITAEWLEL